MRPDEEATFLEELIDRMVTKENSLISTESISWNAFRQAEILDEPGLLPAIEVVAQSPCAKRRGAAYTIAGAIAKNAKYRAAAEFLLARIVFETEKYALAFALDQIQHLDLDESYRIDRIRALIRDQRWLVRRAAITALRCAVTVESETALLDFLENTDDPYDIQVVQFTLNKIGTASSLKILRENERSRKYDVKESAYLAIRAIEARQATSRQDISEGAEFMLEGHSRCEPLAIRLQRPIR